MIDQSIKPELANLVQRLKDMEQTFVVNGVSNYSLSLIKSETENALSVQGNMAQLPIKRGPLTHQRFSMNSCVAIFQAFEILIN